MSRAYVSTPRYGLVAFVLLACFGVLIYRLFELHVLDSARLSAIAEQNRQTMEHLYARRGDVLDDRGNILATTSSVIELGVDPKLVEPKDLAKLPTLARLIGVPEANLEEAFQTKVRETDTVDGPQETDIRWTKLSDGIDDKVYAQVQALKIKAVYGNRKFPRVYPGAELAAHVLGFVNSEGTPQMGVESTMDFYLRGQDGWRETEHDGHGKELAQFGSREVDPTDGLSVQLTIDAMLQNYAENEVTQLADQYHPEGISIIISEPSTGDILALANYPTFDPNHYGDAAVGNLTDRAVTDAFEPGSVFKIVTVAAALNEGLVKPEDRFDCSLPTISYRDHILKLPKDDEPNGVLSVEEIVAHSSNRGAANMGVLLGNDRMRDYAHAFGFGQTTGVPLGAESRGVLKPISDWYTDTAMITHVPMGHGVSATALQVHQAMSVIANGGVLMQPHLVKRVLDAKGETVVSFAPKAERRVVSAHSAEQTVQMLCDVVSANGTAVKAKLDDITVAGKTGTAQKVVDGKYSTTHHVSTFSGFFPAERPRLVITVIVDDAQMKGVAYGGTVSAPAFQKVAQEAVEYLGIQPVGGKSNLVAMKGDNLDWFR